MSYDVEELELEDGRVEFVADYVLKTFKVRADRWTKLYEQEENRKLITDFFEKPEILSLLVLSPGGTLQLTYDWPTQVR